MKSHFTIRRAPKGDVFRLRLFLTSEDAEKFRYADRILVTRSGKNWERYGFAKKVVPRPFDDGWAWECMRQNDQELLEYFGDAMPEERRYYSIRLTINGIFVKVGNEISKEEIE